MSETPRTLSQQDLKRLKILIVDPNAYMRGVVGDSLRRLQIVNVVLAASATEAFSIGRSFKPDIIFVDWDAGRTSGLEFTREVRRNTTGIPRETPIILLSGMIDHEQLMASRQAGINEFLLKPVSAQSVMSRIEEVVLRPRKFVISRNYIGPCRRRKDDPDFAGPWRRLTDEPPVSKRQIVTPENALRLRALITQLTEYIDRPNDDRAAGIRGIFRLFQKHRPEVEALTDEVITRVWDTALRYIEGVGMTDAYDVEVIRFHFQTIGRIIDMPEEASLHRTTVASELERLVAKRIASAHEAQSGAA